ncbi:MAG: NAD(P)/FAD-dependent oxidoreductase [Chloroflexota bacterium]
MIFDVVVLGGGPSGVVAALRARELGASVAIVERDRLGGTCTNDGCVPTRVLAKAARLLRDAQQFETYGLVGGTIPRPDFARIMDRTRAIVEDIHSKKELLRHFDRAGITAYVGVGNAKFVNPNTVETADGQRIEGKKFIICVGGRARKLPFPGAEHTLTHSDVWQLKQQPDSVVIVGSGATGCQLASVFEAFGTHVTLLDIAPRILMGEDADVSEHVMREFLANGIDVLVGTEGIMRVEKNATNLTFVYGDDGMEKTINTDAVIMAVGWPGNTDSLGLEAAGVETERSYISVDDNLRTTADHIFAAGDITGRMMLVQSASDQARTAVENALLNANEREAHRLVPHGGFTDPEYGSVGLTEIQAREKFDVLVATVPYRDLDRAVIDDREVGFCKLVVDRGTHQVIGAHVVGEQAVEIVSMVSAGMAAGMTIEQLADLQLAYPTFAAVVGLAAREITREIGITPVAPVWRAMMSERAAEWERA